MKVLYLTNIPSPYRIAYFNELGKKCDLTVVFERRGSSERDKSWEEFSAVSFKSVFLDGIHVGVDSSISLGVLSYITADYDHIFVTNFSDITGILAIAKLKVKGINYYLESDGGFAGSGKGMKEWIKRQIISGADRYYSTGRIHDQYYLMYGAVAEKLYWYPFSSINMCDVVSIDTISQESKENFKRDLGIPERKMILMVGQFIYRKGIDVLLNALKHVERDVGVYIIGGTPTDEYMELVARNKLQNVHFFEFMPKSELSKYYRAADLFVFPTREDIWGLVVNEALAYGVPVLTTERCLAGTELICDHRNGFLVPVDDDIAVAKCINEYFSERTNRVDYMKYSVQVARRYTIESMAQAHVDSMS